MANLTPCKDCGQQISIRAPTCPRCGTLNPGVPEAKPSLFGCIFSILMLVGFGYLLYWSYNTIFPTLTPAELENRQQEQAQQDRDRLPENRNAQAYFMTRTTINTLLVAPATAEFSSRGNTEIGRLSGTEDQWLVRGYVDSENSFGAKIRSNYQIIFEFEPGSIALKRLVSVDGL